MNLGRAFLIPALAAAATVLSVGTSSGRSCVVRCGGGEGVWRGEPLSFRIRISLTYLFRICLLVLVLNGGGAVSLRAQLPLFGDLGVHDPSRITKQGNTYAVFATGQNVPIKVSTNMRDWSYAGEVFPAGPPAWTREIPGFGDFFWAPDIVKVNDVYYLYYAACGDFGAQQSGIGLATATNILGPWTDQGRVVQSHPGDPVNAIDPAPILDSDGTLWLTYGSSFGTNTGLYVMRLDPLTGKQLAGSVQTRVVGGGCEASYIHKHGSYYYMFINYDTCCNGPIATYNIRMGRSTSITGPYYDRSGRDLNSFSTTLFAESSGRYMGPGHAGFYQENGIEYLSYHAYDGNNNGAPFLSISTVSWGNDGWPILNEEFAAQYTFDVDAREHRGVYNGTLENGAAIVAEAGRGKVLRACYALC